MKVHLAYISVSLRLAVFITFICQNILCITRIDPDVFKNITELITSKGYPCEDFTVTTADGFLLGIQRIPYGVKGQGHNRQKPVVFLQHGLLCDSTLWVTNTVQDSLGFQLADAGLMCGWETLEEILTLKNIHLCLQFKKSSGIGGKTTEKSDTDEVESPCSSNSSSVPQFWTVAATKMLLSEYKDKNKDIGKGKGSKKKMFQEIAKLLNSKGFLFTWEQIKQFIALAPVAYLGHTETPLKILKDWPEWLYFDIFGMKDFLPSDWFFKLMAVTACRDRLTLPICTNTLFVICGYDQSNLNKSRLPVYISHNPAGTSVKNMIHFLQALQSGKYQRYDYGVEGNMLHYGQPTPPQYDLGRIKTQIRLYSADNDWLADPRDVKTLESKIVTKFNSTVIPMWNHLDFAWAIDARKILYDNIIQDLRNGG